MTPKSVFWVLMGVLGLSTASVGAEDRRCIIKQSRSAHAQLITVSIPGGPMRLSTLLAL